MQFRNMHQKLDFSSVLLHILSRPYPIVKVNVNLLFLMVAATLVPSVRTRSNNVRLYLLSISRYGKPL